MELQVKPELRMLRVLLSDRREYFSAAAQNECFCDFALAAMASAKAVVTAHECGVGAGKGEISSLLKMRRLSGNWWDFEINEVMFDPQLSSLPSSSAPSSASFLAPFSRRRARNFFFVFFAFSLSSLHSLLSNRH